MGFVWNPITGQLDISGQAGSGPSQDAVRLVISRVASETISAMQLVKSDNSTHVSLSTSNGSFEDSEVLGLALGSANIGQFVDILIFGAVQDNSFSFTLNEPVFLGVNGLVTQSIPVLLTSSHFVRIGKAIAVDELFLNIEQPIVL
jgi:hypothetical protein